MTSSESKYMVNKKASQNTAYHSLLCAKEHAASLNCSIDNYENKDEVCAKFFDEYKSCKKQERLKRLEQNRRG